MPPIKPKNKINDAISSASVTSGVSHPHAAIRPVTDPSVLDQGRVFREAQRQTQPLYQPGSTGAKALANTIRTGTARPQGLTPDVALRQTTSPSSLDTFTKGANSSGKAAEVVVVSDYRSLHQGQNPGIVNPPSQLSTNVQDIRLSPDVSSRKDLIFGFERSNGELCWKYNGQVKTGSSEYIADSLVEMAKKPGYGRVAYVNARYVNPDGTPRIGIDAFSEKQARQLQEAKVQLRGIQDLEKRAGKLQENIKAYKADGLDPVARKELVQLRTDIQAAYMPGKVAGRIVGGSAMAALSASMVSLVVQLATEGKVDAMTVGQAAGTGAAVGAISVVSDAGLYHLAAKFLEMPPELAKAFAQQGVAIGFCVLAVGVDLMSEVEAARHGEVTKVGAISGMAVKTALDILPLVMAPLGLAGLPVLIGVQMGGRWLLSKAREEDRVLLQARQEDAALADSLLVRMDQFSSTVEEATIECEATDALFHEVMGDTGSHCTSNFRFFLN
jgi:hypothetical protein